MKDQKRSPFINNNGDNNGDSDISTNSMDVHNFNFDINGDDGNNNGDVSCLTLGDNNDGEEAGKEVEQPNKHRESDDKNNEAAAASLKPSAKYLRNDGDKDSSKDAGEEGRGRLGEKRQYVTEMVAMNGNRSNNIKQKISDLSQKVRATKLEIVSKGRKLNDEIKDSITKLSIAQAECPLRLCGQ